MKCNSPERLRQFLGKQYNVTPTYPSGLASKHELPGALVVTVYNTGSVVFQGNSHESQAVKDITAYVEILNRAPVDANAKPGT